MNTTLPIPDEVSIAYRKLACQFQPDIAFTMDLALMKDSSISVVEYNCINICFQQCVALDFVDKTAYDGGFILVKSF